MKTQHEDRFASDSPKPLAAFLVGGGIFLERCIYYANRSMLVLFVVRELGMEEFLYSFRNSLPLTLILAAISGMLIDFMVSKRTMMVYGALLNAVGLGCIATGFDVAVVAGLGLTLVGASAARVSGVTYFGWMLGNHSNKLEGGFSLLWVILNLAAFLGSLIMGLLVLGLRITYQTGFWGLAALALLHAVCLGAFSGVGILPSTAANSGARPPKPFLQVLGGIVLLLLAASLFVYHFWTLQPVFLLMSGMLIDSILLVILVLGFVLFAAAPGANPARRNAIMLLLILVSACIWALFELGNGLAMGKLSSEQANWKVHLQVVFVVLLNLGIGLFFLLRKSSGQKGFSSAGFRILLGSMLLTLGACFILLFPYIGFSSVMGNMLFLTVGEALCGYLLFATVWRMAPKKRRGTALGLLIASVGLGEILAGWFSGSGMDIGGKPINVVHEQGFWIVGFALVFAAIGAWSLLRNHQTETDAPGDSPFA